jgi:hypothetical protein
MRASGSITHCALNGGNAGAGAGLTASALRGFRRRFGRGASIQ